MSQACTMVFTQSSSPSNHHFSTVFWQRSKTSRLATWMSQSRPGIYEFSFNTTALSLNLCKAQCPWWLLKQSHSPAFCSVHDTLSSLLLPLPPMTSSQTVGYVYANTLNTKKTMGVKVTQYLSVYPSNYHADISSVSIASKITEAPQT